MRAYAAHRSLSTCRHHPSSRFQLAKMRLTKWVLSDAVVASILSLANPKRLGNRSLLCGAGPGPTIGGVLWQSTLRGNRQVQCALVNS